MDLDKYTAFILDIDGVLVRNRDPVPGAVDGVQALARRGSVVLLTNNSTADRRTVAERLSALGFPLTEAQIVTSAYVAAHDLAERFGTQRVWPVGEEGLVRELAAAGHQLADPKDAQWVIAGMDRHLTYKKLAHTLEAFLAGARFLATNRDATFPVESGQLPGAGAVVGALEGMGFPPEAVVGKPTPAAFRAALSVAGAGPEQALMVGDRLETDIAGAAEVGMDTALVLTGVTSTADVARRGIRPTWIAASLGDLASGKAKPG